ncbi:hypothetical protein HA402_008183 [Bradysia odoriphaga]|nr:hypothetical protein HA402_008183 [Bradysia odoriphaga]
MRMRMEKFLYTLSTPYDSVHRCAIAFSKNYAVTFQHEEHSLIQPEEQIIIYNIHNPATKYEVIVKVVSHKSQDFIILQNDVGFPEYPHHVVSMFTGQRYLQLGIDQLRQPKWKDGIVSQYCFGFYVGTSHGEIGDSGSGIFDTSGNFMGISVAKKNFTFSNPFDCKIDCSEIADHHPYTKIISGDVVYSALNIGSAGFSPFKQYKPDC